MARPLPRNLAGLQSYLVGILAGLLLIGGGAVWGFVRDEIAYNRLDQVVEEEIRLGERLAAERCVDLWTIVTQLRASDVEHGLAAGEALIEIAEAEPEVADRYRETLRQQLQESSARVEGPTCDLDDARQTLEGDPP